MNLPEGFVLDQSPAQPDYSGAISKVESGGNYRAIGPVTRDGDRAVGKYQVMGKNVRPWTKEVLGQELTPLQFAATPEAQDAVFKAKFGSYVDKYGPEGAAKAWFAGEGGMNDPNRRDSLGTTVAGYANKFMSALGPSSANAAERPTAKPPEPSGLPAGFVLDGSEAPASFNDRFSAAQSGSAPPDGLRAGLLAKADQMALGPQATPGEQLATATDNLVPAASQGTNPNVDRYAGKLISSEAFQSDSGEILYRDPVTGAVKPTDTKTQVAIRDPRDNTVKIFERSEATNEGPAVGVARVLAPGLVSGAPTARPGIALQAIPKPAPGQEVAQAAQRLGVEVPRAVTTDSMATQRMAAATRNVPLAGDPLVKGSERAISQLGTKAADVAQGYGSGTVIGAGDTAKGAIKEYITGTTASTTKKLYDAVDNLVDDAKVVPLTLTKGVAAEINARRTTAALGDSKAVAAIQDAIDRPGLTYSGIKDLRTSIGETLKQGILPEGMSQGELKQIYSALSDDLKSTVAVAGGPKASAAFERANNYYRLVSGRREALAKIVGANGDAPVEQVFDRLLAKASSSSRSDIASLAQARKAIGADDWNEFASGVVSRLGRDPAAITGPDALSATEFSPQRFLTAYGKLSPAGRDLLFRSGGKSDLANALNDIAKVSSRFKELQKFANPSGTSQNVAGGGIVAGALTAPLTTLATIVGGRVVASALAKPASAASIAQWAENYERLVRTPTMPRVAAFELASRNLISNLKDAGVSVSPQDFLRAIQAPAKSAAEDEQQPVPRGPRQ